MNLKEIQQTLVLGKFVSCRKKKILQCKTCHHKHKPFFKLLTTAIEPAQWNNTTTPPRPQLEAFKVSPASWLAVRGREEANACLSWVSHVIFGGKSTGCSQFSNLHLNITRRGSAQKNRQHRMFAWDYKDRKPSIGKVNLKPGNLQNVLPHVPWQQ